MSIAIALVRESSALMVGQYFKRRRDFVEIVVQIGAGIGVILFSVFFKEALGLVVALRLSVFLFSFFFCFACCFVLLPALRCTFQPPLQIKTATSSSFETAFTSDNFMMTKRGLHARLYCVAGVIWSVAVLLLLFLLSSSSRCHSIVFF